MMAGKTLDESERKWLRDGPGLDELVGERRDGRRGKRKRKAAVVIPAYGRPEILKEHLRRLSGQAGGDFDIIVVYGKDDRFLAEADAAGAVQLRRRHDSGSAGGFYTGERFALDEGYGIVILADDDAYPVSESLVGDLIRAVEDGADIAMPMLRTFDDEEPIKSDIIARYGAIGSAMLRKAGLTYMPFYFAGEDLELLARIRRHGGRVVNVDSLMHHPPLASSMFVNHPVKLFYYSRSIILASFLGKSAFDTMSEIFSTLMYGFFFAPFRRQLSRSMREAAFKTAGMEVFRSKFARDDDVAPAPIAPSGCVKAWHLTDGIVQGKGAYAKISSAASSFFRYFAQMPGIFGRDIVLENAVGHSGVPLALLARNSCLKLGHEGGAYPVFSGNMHWLFPVYLAYLLLALLLSSLLAPALAFAGYLSILLKGIRTDGYGAV